MSLLLNYIPIISGMLLFIGYLNYDTFYSQFDIQIVNFLTTGELILSFMPLTKPLLILGAYYGLMVFLIATLSRESTTWVYYERADFLENTKSSYSELKQLVMDKKWKTPRQIAWIVITVLMLILSFCFATLFVLYPLIIIALILGADIDGYIGFWIIFSIVWLLQLQNRIFNTKANEGFRKQVLVISPIAMFIALIVIYNQSKAEDILKGDTQLVSIDLGTQVISSGTDTLYIGRTNEFIFMHILSTKSNLTISDREIRHFHSFIKPGKENPDD